MQEPSDFSKQNRFVLDWLRGGGTINRIEAIAFGITALNSRISDLRNRYKIPGIIGKTEAGSKCKRYYIAQEYLNQAA